MTPVKVPACVSSIELGGHSSARAITQPSLKPSTPAKRFRVGLMRQACDRFDEMDSAKIDDMNASRRREPRGPSRLSTENSLFAIFKPANMFLAVELDAELFDELQLRFQKIDVLFLID